MPLIPVGRGSCPEVSGNESLLSPKPSIFPIYLVTMQEPPPPGTGDAARNSAYIYGYDGEASDISVTREFGFSGAWAGFLDTLVAWPPVIYVNVRITLAAYGGQTHNISKQAQKR